LGANKAPALDGFQVGFFQKNWEIMGVDIWTLAEECKKKKAIFKAWNTTYLALIPNKNSLDFFDEMRPISLCNSIYKIVSKAIATRLKSV
jgi:hypothetical protein